MSCGRCPRIERKKKRADRSTPYTNSASSRMILRCDHFGFKLLFWVLFFFLEKKREGRESSKGPLPVCSSAWPRPHLSTPSGQEPKPTPPPYRPRFPGVLKWETKVRGIFPGLSLNCSWKRPNLQSDLLACSQVPSLAMYSTYPIALTLIHTPHHMHT